MVFNTWFDQFEVLEVPRLRQQLQAAKDGLRGVCDRRGLVRPAGRRLVRPGRRLAEKTDGAFRGSMAAFADEVRAAGLGFGLWMEPDALGRTSHSSASIPSGFTLASRPSRGSTSKIQPPMRGFWRNLPARRNLPPGVDEIEFNFELGHDGSGGELSGYYRAWYRLLDEIR